MTGRQTAYFLPFGSHGSSDEGVMGVESNIEKVNGEQ